MDLEILVKKGRTTKDRIEKAKDVEVKFFRKTDGQYIGEVSSSGKVYSPSIDLKSKEFQCSCSDFIHRKKICKHILAGLMYLKKKDNAQEEIKPKEREKSCEFFSCGCQKIDNLFGGGLPKQCLSVVFSNYNTGKTWFCYQSSSKISSVLGKHCLYIDTEDFFRTKNVRNRFKGYFERRFGAHDIDFKFVPGIKQFAELLGIDLSFEYSAKKQMTVRQKPNCGYEDSPLASLLSDKKYPFVVVDSFSAPFKAEIPTPPRENYPARASLIQSILGRLRLIIVDSDIPSLLAVHSSRDPTAFGRSAPYGAGPVGYNVKYIFFIGKSSSPEMRKFRRFRAPGLESSEALVELKRDYGYR